MLFLDKHQLCFVTLQMNDDIKFFSPLLTGGFPISF